MTFNNTIQTTEPAFLSYEKSTANRARPITGFHKSLTDCCYSVSNLALIVACILALVFLVKFLHDEPLYEYGEHLLTLKFYRQLVYIIVVIPLVLLVPLFNAASAFFLSGRQKFELGKSLLTLKMFYQILMALLVFIGLIFIVPSIRFSSVASQLEYELRKHMKRRYENDFSFEFLDSIQAEYECCDELWYRANLNDRLPLSCFQPNNLYNLIHEQSCADVLGSLVSNRCIVIAASLLAILVALASLTWIDIIELLSFSNRQYDVGLREAKRQQHSDHPGAITEATSLTTTTRQQPSHSRDTADRDLADELVEEISSRLKLQERERERERETPLLPQDTTRKSNGQRLRESPVVNIDDDDDEHDHNHRDWQYPNQQLASGDARRTAPTILTRANYVYTQPKRSQSPVFVGGGSDGGKFDELRASSSCLLTQTAGNGTRSGTPTPTKGVLKKSSSFQRIDSDYDDQQSDADDYQRGQMQRDQQTRRSLLSVRFADE